MKNAPLTNSNGNNSHLLSIYTAVSASSSAITVSLDRQLRWLSAARLLCFGAFIFFGYKAIQTGAVYFTLSSISGLVIFLVLIRIYDKLETRLSFYKALVKINEHEIRFLQGEPSVHPNGKEYTDPQHPYSYDLDLFGEGGLYPYLNRCSTSFGREELANIILYPDKKEIQHRQEAIQELKEKREFRQHIQAYGMTQDTKDKEMKQLKSWLDTPSFFTNKIIYYFLFLFPLATAGCLVYYMIAESDRALNLFYASFLLNLVISLSFTRKIMAHLSVSSSVTKILQQFSRQLKEIQSQKFESVLLKQLQQKLKGENKSAAASIAQLASLFNYLETIINLVVSSLLNGFFLFHVHVLFALEKWKKQNGGEVMNWLRLLGETEALNSLANFSFNNPSFCCPIVSSEATLETASMGHPLIRTEKRISNTISFAQKKLVLLTGSNMSGKSTFLRTLGINMVLARAGSVVCAEKFTFYPYDIHVSMRISDSLQDSESFFYAELKRLQHIILQLNAGDKIFVILDEILRGTNSNDKHSGTVGLIRKLAAAGTAGIIATHDLTVSKLADEYPGYISNKCFESEITGDELLFDFKLRDGVCTTLSASFLMNKMGIIDKS